MIEFFVSFFLAVAAIEVAVDAGGKAYDYVEPKVTEGVEYVQDKINPEEQE